MCILAKLHLVESTLACSLASKKGSIQLRAHCYLCSLEKKKKISFGANSSANETACTIFSGKRSFPLKSTHLQHARSLKVCPDAVAPDRSPQAEQHSWVALVRLQDGVPVTEIWASLSSDKALCHAQLCQQMMNFSSPKP